MLRDAIARGDLAWEGRVLAACHVLERVTSHDGSAAALQTFADHHTAFHDALASACPSTYLLDFRARLWTLSERYRNLAASRYAASPDRDIVAEHRELAQAAVARDSDRACAVLTAHLQQTATTLQAAYPQLFVVPPS